VVIDRWSMREGGATRDLDADRGPKRDVNALCGQRAMSR
jgi:hypothetical protein